MLFLRMDELFAIFYNSCFDHLTKKVISLTGTLTYTGKYRHSFVGFGNVINQFLDQNGFTYTGTTEQSDFSSFGIRLKQVDYLDTGKQRLCFGRKVFVTGSRTVNGTTTAIVKVTQTINGFTYYVQQTPFDVFSYGNFDRRSGI